MGHLTNLIPLVMGLLLIFFPRIFTRAKGEAFEPAREKLRFIGFLLLGVAALYFMASLLKPTPTADLFGPNPKRQMDRIQARTPSGSDWYLAESAQGAFSVLIPVPFNEFSTAVDDAATGPIKTHTVGGRSEEGLKFSATRMPFLSNREPVDLGALPRDMAASGQKISEIVETPFSGWPAISFAASGPGRGAYFRYVKTRDSYYMVILEYPNAYQSKAAAMKSRFLDSLVIKTPPGSEAPEKFEMLSK